MRLSGSSALGRSARAFLFLLVGLTWAATLPGPGRDLSPQERDRLSRLLEEGGSLLASGQPGAAAETFSEALLLAPDSDEALRQYVRSLVAAGADREAEAEYRAEAGDNPWARYALGVLLLARGSSGAQEAAAELSAAAEAGIPGAAVAFGEALLLAGRSEEAVEVLEGVLAGEGARSPLTGRVAGLLRRAYATCAVRARERGEDEQARAWLSRIPALEERIAALRRTGGSAGTEAARSPSPPGVEEASAPDVDVSVPPVAREEGGGAPRAVRAEEPPVEKEGVSASGGLFSWVARLGSGGGGSGTREERVARLAAEEAERKARAEAVYRARLEARIARKQRMRDKAARKKETWLEKSARKAQAEERNARRGLEAMEREREALERKYGEPFVLVYGGEHPGAPAEEPIAFVAPPSPPEPEPEVARQSLPRPSGEEAGKPAPPPAEEKALFRGKALVGGGGISAVSLPGEATGALPASWRLVRGGAQVGSVALSRVHSVAAVLRTGRPLEQGQTVALTAPLFDRMPAMRVKADYGSGVYEVAAVEPPGGLQLESLGEKVDVLEVLSVSLVVTLTGEERPVLGDLIEPAH